MKANPNLDELLNSFADGELSPRQRTEVQRMAARNPAVARRLRRLQNVRALYAGLPQAEAPADLLEQIRQSLERQTLLQPEPVVLRHTAGRAHLVFRKLVAAAAMIALMGVLGAVVYQIVAPVPNAGTPPMVAELPVESALEAEAPLIPSTVVADAGITGRLELRTGALAQTDAFLRQAIENAGLSEIAEIETTDDRRIFRVASTREGVNRLVASLGSAWPRIDDATLHVARPGDGAESVQIETVTPEQTVAILARKSTEASMRAARAYAAMNHMIRSAPGSQILAVIQEDTANMLAEATVPRPVLTSNGETPKTTRVSPEGKIQADLTIVLLRAR